MKLTASQATLIALACVLSVGGGKGGGGGVEAIECYECTYNSMLKLVSVEECSEDRFNIPKGNSKYTGTNCQACTKTAIYADDGSLSLVTRACSPVKAADDGCSNILGDKKKMVCSCTSDYCNSALNRRSVNAQTALLALLSLAFVFLFNRK